MFYTSGKFSLRRVDGLVLLKVKKGLGPVKAYSSVWLPNCHMSLLGGPIMTSTLTAPLITVGSLADKVPYKRETSKQAYRVESQ